MKNTKKTNETIKNNKSEKLTEDTFVAYANAIVELIEKQTYYMKHVAEYEGKVLDKLDKQNCILRDILDKLKFWNFR